MALAPYPSWVERVDLSDRLGPRYPGTRGYPGATKYRRPEEVDGIVLHQTATRFPVGRYWLRKADGDERRARQLRVLRVAAHYIALRDLQVVKGRPTLAYVHHANRLNRPTLGVEVEGRFPGLEDVPETAPREDLLTTWGLAKGETPDEADRATVDAAREAVAWAYEDGRRAGCPLRYIYAHRQSNGSRRADPGEALWEAVAVDFAVAVLHLEVRPTYVLGSGRPLPAVWDPAGVGPY